MDIYRRDPDGFEYFIRFSKETIEKLVEKFNKNGSNRRINFNHTNQMVDAFINASWIKEGENDKSTGYPVFKDLPVGTWFIEVKVEDDKFWNTKVKEEGFYSFSIEGILGLEKVEMKKVEYISINDYIDSMSEEDFFEVYTDLIKKKPVRFLQTYNDYPEVVKNNAKRALNWVEKNGWGSCGTAVGKARANQLAKGENISRDTISRMASFARHLQYDNKELGDGCAKLMILAWGGREGIEWAQRKLKEIDTKMAEVGERGAIVPSKKAPKSDTPNPKPEGEGTAKGDASTSRGAKVSERVEKILKDKSDDFNERYKEKLGYGVNVGMLKSVYQRGVGAFNVSHSPRVQSAEQWALARVNAFLYIVKNGRPENSKYVNDNDLLPKEHPKYSK
jgi:hypothetical protein